MLQVILHWTWSIKEGEYKSYKFGMQLANTVGCYKESVIQPILQIAWERHQTDIVNR